MREYLFLDLAKGLSESDLEVGQNEDVLQQPSPEAAKEFSNSLDAIGIQYP